MVEPLMPPSRKNPLIRTRVPASPPSARSRTGLFFSTYAALGEFRLQRCDDCGVTAYPPRDICANCLSDNLVWRETIPEAKVIAETTLHASTNVYFRERMPWRVGTVKLGDGVIIVAHLHSDVREGDEAYLIARTDKAGQGVLLALPKEETSNMSDDKQFRGLTCDPKHRRILITDARTPLGQAMAHAALEAGAAKVFLGVANQWKPFEGAKEICKLKNSAITSLNLDDETSVLEAASAIGGKVDILINTAQHIRPGSALARKDTVTEKDEMEVNYFWPLRLLKAFGPIMSGRGADGANSATAWVNCLPVYALSNWPAFGGASASFAAAHSLSQNARAEFAGSGVKLVNAFHGPLDDEWGQPLPPPKVAPSRMAKEVMRGLQEGVEELYIGDIAKDMRERRIENAYVSEREMAAMMSGSGE